MILQRFQQLLSELSIAHHPEPVLKLILSQLAKDFSIDLAALFMISQNTGDYELITHHGVNTDKLKKKIIFKRLEGLIGLVEEREESVTIESMNDHELSAKTYQLHLETLESFMGIPIFSRGELVAIIVLMNRPGKIFTEHLEAQISTICLQLGDAINRCRSMIERSSGSRRKKQFVLEGISGGFGVAIGKAVVVYPPADLESVPDKTISDVQQEIDVFETALQAARDEMQDLKDKAQMTLSDAESVLFDVYLRMLDSRSLMNEVIDEIKQGVWSQTAVKRVIQKHAVHFSSLKDSYLSERAADFRDLGRRILSHLQKNVPQDQVFHKNTILISDEVSATALVEVPEGCLMGVISGQGSCNSHVAILARSMGLPSVLSVAGIELDQLAGKELIVDGFNGQVFVNPSSALKKDFMRLIEEEHDFDRQLAPLWDAPAVTEDGREIKLYVNTGLASDSGLTLRSGADGIGLYRTELPFMMRDRFPTKEEQRIMYRQLLNSFSPRPVVMRTLDIGGDKALPYFPFNEDNPFLGWRGIRISIDQPNIFLQQVKAMLQASDGLENLSIMLPMISSVSEVEIAKTMIEQVYHEIKQGEDCRIKMPKLGLMIEVPAAVYQVVELAKQVDFISVGSNDLVQYLLAVDRNNPRVANRYSSLHPAVLHALNTIVKGAHKANRKVSICGEMASDPLAILLLLGMGFDSLSVNARNLARAKWMIRRFTYDGAKQLVKVVLKMTEASEIQSYMETVIDDAGMGALIRAGY